LALPHGIVGLQFAYRKSWFDEVGQTTWPKTLDELRQVGMKLKKKGKPIGQTLGHTFGDAPAWAYPLTWGFGGQEVDRTGKKVMLDSKATLEAVKFMQAYWKDACDEGGFARGLPGRGRSARGSGGAEGFRAGATRCWGQPPRGERVDPPMRIYRQAAAASRMIGYAGPPSARATEAYTKYVIVDMYAKAC